MATAEDLAREARELAIEAKHLAEIVELKIDAHTLECAERYQSIKEAITRLHTKNEEMLNKLQSNQVRFLWWFLGIAGTIIVLLLTKPQLIGG